MNLVKLFGIAFNGTTIYLPGTKYTPYILQMIIGESHHIKVIEAENLDKLFKKINLLKEYIVECFQRENKIPLFIGGEHTITYFVMHSISELINKEICVITFDAHADMHDSLYGYKISNGTFMRRLIENGLVDNVILIGVRIINEDEKEFIDKLKIHSALEIITTSDITNKWTIHHRLKYLLEHLRCKHLHVSIDVDVFDPKIAPGVCNPVPNGIDLNTFKLILTKILSTFRFKMCKNMSITFDIVEANPIIDKGLKTTLLVKDLTNLINNRLYDRLLKISGW